MKKTVLLLIASAFILSACGNKPAMVTAGADIPQPAATPNVTANPSPDAAQSPAPAAETTPTPIPTPVPTPKPSYYMSSAYFIKPIAATTNNKVVLLTFDDGPKQKDQVEQMLKILDKHHAKAIFFVNGYRVKQNPELVKEIYNAGQTIGNHSWDHIDLAKENKAKVEKQIGDVQNIVKDLTGKAPVFFRPPFGTGKGFVKEVCKQNNLLFMTWSNGSLDWADNQHKPEGVIKSVMDQLHPGSNILMHELPWTIEALDKLLTELEDKGYSFADPASIDLQMSKDQQK